MATILTRGGMARANGWSECSITLPTLELNFNLFTDLSDKWFEGVLVQNPDQRQPVDSSRRNVKS